MNVYIHGNCQALALVELMREVASETLQIDGRACYQTDLDQGLQDHIAAVRSADIIVHQPISDGYRGVQELSLGWARENTRPDAILVEFPVIHHSGQMPQIFTLGEFTGDRMEYHDAHAIDYFLRRLPAEAFVADMLSADFLPSDFARSEAFGATLDLMRRESISSSGITSADLIVPRFHREQPMFTVNHPARNVLAGVANRILAHAYRPERIAIEGREPLDAIILTPYPSVATALEYSGSGLPLGQVRYAGEWVDAVSYYGAVFETYQDIGYERVKAAAAGSRGISEYLDRFARAKGTAYDTDSVLVRQAYSLFLARHPNDDELRDARAFVDERGLTDFLATFPASEEFVGAGGFDGLGRRYQANGGRFGPG